MFKRLETLRRSLSLRTVHTRRPSSFETALFLCILLSRPLSSLWTCQYAFQAVPPPCPSLFELECCPSPFTPAFARGYRVTLDSLRELSWAVVVSFVSNVLIPLAMLSLRMLSIKTLAITRKLSSQLSVQSHLVSPCRIYPLLLMIAILFERQAASPGRRLDRSNESLSRTMVRLSSLVTRLLRASVSRRKSSVHAILADFGAISRMKDDFRLVSHDSGLLSTSQEHTSSSEYPKTLPTSFLALLSLVSILDLLAVFGTFAPRSLAAGSSHHAIPIFRASSAGSIPRCRSRGFRRGLLLQVLHFCVSSKRSLLRVTAGSLFPSPILF